MTFEAIMNDLDRQHYARCYILAGEEPFFIDEVTRRIEQDVLPPANKDFNQLVFYGNETSMENVIHAARQYPMIFTSPQVVVLKEAQLIRNGWDQLADYVEHPQESTILVVAYKKKFDKRTKLYKAINQSGVFLDSAKLYENKMPAWVKSYAATQGYDIPADAVMMLLECVGNDMAKIAGEIRKLSIVMPEGSKRITADLVEKNIGVSKEYNVFELQKALAVKDVLKANRIVDHFATNPNASPLVMVIAMLFQYFAKLLRFQYLKGRPAAEQAAAMGINPFFLKEYEAAARIYPVGKLVTVIHELRLYDARSKGADGTLSTSSTAMLKELVYKILH